MAGMLGDVRVNLPQREIDNLSRLGHSPSVLDDKRPKVLDIKEELLMAILHKLDNISPKIFIEG